MLKYLFTVARFCFHFHLGAKPCSLNFANVRSPLAVSRPFFPRFARLRPILAVSLKATILFPREVNVAPFLWAFSTLAIAVLLFNKSPYANSAGDI